MTHQELISEASKVLRPYRTDDGRLFGDVGSALLGNNGKVYTGTCIDTPSWGICAERSAIAAMVTDGEYVISKIVAVWKDDKTNKVQVVPPCGVCREFMLQVHRNNLDTEVILGENMSRQLKDLIPFHNWPDLADQ
jgi:cytidine deaminase